jgi:hypothetical protein
MPKCGRWWWVASQVAHVQFVAADEMTASVPVEKVRSVLQVCHTSSVRCVAHLSHLVSALRYIFVTPRQCMVVYLCHTLWILRFQRPVSTHTHSQTHTNRSLDTAILFVHPKTCNLKTTLHYKSVIFSESQKFSALNKKYSI